ncbi:MAG: hypothetical protein JRG91_16775 [Deltaproteobacteria bacterium]|nr:hypothetical protein [Deltaproteobacteria bacterium]
MEPEDPNRSPEPVEGEPEPVAEPVPEPEPEPEPIAEPEPEPESAPEASAQPDVVIPLEGSLVSRKGKKVVIEVDHPDPPAAGGKGTLLKYFEKQVGPFATSGWLAIAEVTVTKSAGGKIHLKIVELLSKMVVNGKKVNHFKKGNRIKLELE